MATMTAFDSVKSLKNQSIQKRQCPSKANHKDIFGLSFCMLKVILFMLESIYQACSWNASNPSFHLFFSFMFYSSTFPSISISLLAFISISIFTSISTFTFTFILVFTFIFYPIFCKFTLIRHQNLQNLYCSFRDECQSSQVTPQFYVFLGLHLIPKTRQNTHYFMVMLSFTL